MPRSRATPRSCVSGRCGWSGAPRRVPLGVGGDASIAGKFGMTPETLRKLGAAGRGRRRRRPGFTTDERAALKELENENRELRRANEILKAASVFFATELDGRTKR